MKAILGLPAIVIDQSSRNAAVKGRITPRPMHDEAHRIALNIARLPELLGAAGHKNDPRHRPTQCEFAPVSPWKSGAVSPRLRARPTLHLDLTL